MTAHSSCSSSIVCYASQHGLLSCADTCAHTLSAWNRLGSQARQRVRATAGLSQGPVSSRLGLSAAVCSGNGFATAAASSSSSWRLHAVGSQGTTAETASSDMASSPVDEATPPDSKNPPSDMSDAIKRAIDEAAIIDERSSREQASSSSSSSQDQSSDSPGSASELLSTKHNESTLSLDLSQLPEPSAPLPAPQPTTKQPGQQSSQQTAKDDSPDAAQLLRKGHNESTISLDLNSLPVPHELSQPPARPQRQPTRAPPQGPNSLAWDDAEPQQPSPTRPGASSQPQRQRSTSGSWDNLQPLFKPPPRTDPPREPQEPPNPAAAADMMFSALQSKRYKHEKGTSYKEATFALIPVDRKVGFLSVALKPYCKHYFKFRAQNCHSGNTDREVEWCMHICHQPSMCDHMDVTSHACNTILHFMAWHTTIHCAKQPWVVTFCTAHARLMASRLEHITVQIISAEMLCHNTKVPDRVQTLVNFLLSPLQRLHAPHREQRLDQPHVVLQIGWRLSCDEEVTVGQSLHLPQHGPLLLGGGAPLDTISDVMLEGAVDAGNAVKARLELFWKGRKPWCVLFNSNTTATQAG